MLITTWITDYKLSICEQRYQIYVLRKAGLNQTPATYSRGYVALPVAACETLCPAKTNSRRETARISSGNQKHLRLISSPRRAELLLLFPRVNVRQPFSSEPEGNEVDNQSKDCAHPGDDDFAVCREVSEHGGQRRGAGARGRWVL